MSADGRPLHAGNMRAQLNQCIDNLDAVLRAAEFTLADVVRLNLYTTDVDAYFANLDVVMSRGSGLPLRRHAPWRSPPGASGTHD